ncbi:hypothetical protein Tco_0913374 [Tanacetum coccineum]
MLRDLVINGPYKFKSEITAKDTYGVTDIRRKERLKDLKGDDKLRYDSDIKAVNILLLGLPMNKQERESMLFDEFDKFTSEPGESIHSYYLRYAKLINDMNVIPMSMTPMQINTKFVNHLQPEWSSTPITQQLIQSPPLQSYAPPVVQKPPIFQPDTGLAIPTFLPIDDPIASLNKAMMFLILVDSIEVMRAMLEIIKLQEHGLSMQLEIQGQINQGLEETNDYENLQLQATTNFKVDHVDAYDSHCNDEATSNAIFMENVSPVGSLNDDMVAPRYDSDTLSKVPHYDTYHDSDVLNSSIQELGYIETIISTNESYDELKGKNNVISYTDYMLTTGDDANNYVPPPVQKNDMMLSVIEHMKSQVEKCTKVLRNLNKAHNLLTTFDECIKRRTALSPHQIGSWEQSDVKVLGVKRLHGFLEVTTAQVHNGNYAKCPLVTVSTPKVFPKKLPSTSKVLKNLNKARDLLTKFDECIKRRTTLSPHEIGSWEQSHIKGAFKKDVMPFSESLKETFKYFKKGFITEVKEMKDIFEQIEDEVDQCSVAKKSFEIEKKQLLINNDRLLEENIASDIMCTYLRSLNEVDNYGKCKSLNIVLLDLQESNKYLSELRRHFAKLEEYNITLDIAFQNHKEQMILNDPDTKNK